METLTCHSCGELIAEVYLSYDSSVSVGKHQQDLYMVRLDGEGANYRFFCTNCGEPTTWGHADVDNELQPGNSKGFSFRPFNKGWQFAKVQSTESVDADIGDTAISDGIRECAKAFVSNVARVNAIAQFAILAAGIQRLNMMASVHMAGLQIVERSRCGKDPGFDLDSQYTKGFFETYGERAKLERTPISPEVLREINLSGQLSVETWSGVHPEIATGIHAIMLSQITLAWTAFEVLSADLWIASLNERPKPLATNFARSTQPTAQDKSITITALAEYGDHNFDLSKSMGTLFVQQKKVDFTSLETTKRAYEKAFSKDLPAMDEPNLKLLELVRNLILHRGGVVDLQFMKDLTTKQLQSHPDCLAAKTGEPFQINPAIATRLVAAAVDAGTSVLKFVVS